VAAPGRTEPPAALRLPSGWPRRRAPAWLIPFCVIVAGIAVTIGLSHRPSRQQRAADLHGFLYTVTYDIDSCSGDVRRSLQALQAIDAGSSRDTATAVKIARNGAADCSPANNELIDDLENYVVPESLASYHLRGAVTGLIDWAAPDAEAVQSDIAAVLAARHTPAETAARAALSVALRRLDTQRAHVQAVLRPAVSALDPGAAGPDLPG
jgi:hypothetical protein